MKHLSQITDIELLEITKIIFRNPFIKMKDIKVIRHDDRKWLRIEYKEYRINYFYDRFQIFDWTKKYEITSEIHLEIGIYLMELDYKIKIENWRNKPKPSDDLIDNHKLDALINFIQGSGLMDELSHKIINNLIYIRNK